MTKEYNSRPEIKANNIKRMREYYSRPEIKAKAREYYLNHKNDKKK